jgi:hypothetical protein
MPCFALVLWGREECMVLSPASRREFRERRVVPAEETYDIMERKSAIIPSNCEKI